MFCSCQTTWKRWWEQVSSFQYFASTVRAGTWNVTLQTDYTSLHIVLRQDSIEEKPFCWSLQSHKYYGKEHLHYKYTFCYSCNIHLTLFRFAEAVGFPVYKQLSQTNTCWPSTALYVVQAFGTYTQILLVCKCEGNCMASCRSIRWKYCN